MRGAMALNIKDPETERLAAEVARMAGENKTRAIRTALVERRERLGLKVSRQGRRESLMRLLEQEIWPLVPRAVLGKRVTKKERERILGYGRDGV
jgi:antitoxin VapB